MKIKIFIVGLIMAVFDHVGLNAKQINYVEYSNPNVVTTDLYRQSNEFQKDFLLFLNMLDQTHPAFAIQSPFDVDSIRNVGLRVLSDCQSQAFFKSYLQSIVSPLKDGHTGVFLEFNMDFCYPFYLFIDQNGFMLEGISTQYEDYLGKKVCRINNVDAVEVMDGFREIMICENELNFQKMVCGWMQLYDMWENTPYSEQDSTLLLSFADGTEIKLEPQKATDIKMSWQQQLHNSSESPRTPSKLPFRYQIFEDEKICYFQFNACMDQNTYRFQYLMGQIDGLSEAELEEKIAGVPRFDTFLEEMFQAIRNNEIETLVVDVSENSGGNSMLCDQLLSWFKFHDNTEGFGQQIRFSKLWEASYPVLSDKVKKTFSENNISYRLGSLFDWEDVDVLLSDSVLYEKMKEFFVLNSDENKIFKGNVVFIQGKDTYSSAGQLIVEAIDNEIGIVIGEKSSYRPCHYGDLLGWELPNTKAQGYVSHKFFVRPDSERCGEDCVIPQVYIPNTWSDKINGVDACWNWILENYNKK